MKNKRAAGLLILIMAFSSICLAKNSPASDMGDWYYKQFNFKKAALYYTKALKRDKGNETLVQHLADCYRLSNNWAAAQPYYAMLATSGTALPLNKLYYAEALRAAKQYADAQTYYQDYLKSFPQDSSVRERINGMQQIENLSKPNAMYQVTHPDSLNSSYADFGVTVHNDKEIYFASNRKPDVFVRRVDSWTQGMFYELYKANLDSTGKVTGTGLLSGSSVNKKFHEAAPCYNAKLNELYFDRSNYNGTRVFPSADKTVKLEIFKAGWSPDQQEWNGEVKPAVPFNNKEYSVCHPSLNEAGDTLYFTSDMPGGYGRTDIYVSVRELNGEWGTPRNLGPGINTSGDDMFPFIASDKTLYFSSNGHLGLGGLDIFSSKNVNGKWSAPVNLGNPINTNSDDFGLMMKKNNNSGYFCSNREGGTGDDDIYSFVKKGVMIRGITVNGYTGEPVGAAAVVIDPQTEPASLTTDTTAGTFTCYADPNKEYTFNATKEGYRPGKTVQLVTETTGVIRIPLYPIGDIKLEVTVIDRKTREPLDSAFINLTNITTNKEEPCYTDKDGKCYFKVDTATDYGMDVSKETGLPKEKYLAVSVGTSSKGYYPPSTIKELVELDKVKLGVPIKIENIYYDLDKWFIRPDAAVELDKLVKILKDNPTIQIELGSHTDCRASKRYNMELSAKRARSAVEYISTKGIDMKRMLSAGYGESQLVNKCKCEGTSVVPCTEEQHQANRRTEFKILKF